MIVTSKALPRRALLRGAGVALALPLLDAMTPALTAIERTPAAPEKLRRLGFVFIPMGCDQSRWAPPADQRARDEPSGDEPTGDRTSGDRTSGGRDSGEFDRPLGTWSPTLAPLERVRQSVTVISNLELQNAYPGTHATSNAAFLSAATAKRTESTDYFLGTTADQLAARRLGRDTQLASLELSMDLQSTIGQCDNGYACVYQNNLSWSSPTTPLPSEAHPRVVFESLFGDGGTAAERRAALRKRASLLDAVGDEWRRLGRQLGPGDRARVGTYLESVREVERRIQRAEAQQQEQPLPDLDRPEGAPAAYADHARLMFDLQVLALQGDITRVITFQLARETSNRTYPEIGVPEPHHPLTHHGNDPEKIAKVARINRFHVSLFAEFLEKLGQTREGGGTLLDHSLYLYGSGMGNPNVHDHTNLPILVAGGAAGRMRGGRRLGFREATPLANLHWTLLDKVGVRLDSFADSNGPVEGLFEPLSI